MSHIISFGSDKAVQNGFNNQYKHQFPMSSVNFTDTEISVESIHMLNSVYNIDSSVYSNNTVSIQMPTAATTTTYNITFPDGIYDYSSMTQFIQSKLKENGAYLIDQDGNEIHYFKMTANFTYYACQLDCAPVPTSLPSGWSRPATGLYSLSGTGLPTSTRVPILVVNNERFGKLIGYSLGSYPSSPQTTLQSFLSNITPQLHPVTAYTLHCSMVSNPYSIPSDIIATFNAKGAGVSQLISYTPNERNWIKINDGAYQTMTLTITDQDGNYIKIRDPQLLMTINIRKIKN